MAQVNKGRILDSLYKDSNGNVVSLASLRGKIEDECFDLAQYRGDSLAWLKMRGAEMTEFQRAQAEVTNQRLLFYCLEPLTDGISFNSVLQAAGMYIGMSLVQPGIKKEWAAMKKSGAEMVSATLSNNKLLKHLPGSKLVTNMCKHMADKQSLVMNDGRMPYTVMSASTEYLRIENAAYQAMRVPDDQLRPPTSDQITLSSHNWQTKKRVLDAAQRELISLQVAQGDDSKSPEMLSAQEKYMNAQSDADKAKNDLEMLLRANDAWDSLSVAEKRKAHCMCVRADAEECKTLLYEQAKIDGVGRMNIADCVNQMIGNARLRSEQARKDLRAKQREATAGDPAAELRAAWRYGQDNIHDWRKFSEMGFDLDEAKFSDFDSVLVTEMGEDGKPHYKQVNVWDGTFLQNGKPFGDAMHSREPMTPQALMRAMESITSKYREEASPADIERLESASEFAMLMVDGYEQHEAYDLTLGQLEAGLVMSGLSQKEIHERIRPLRNYVSDMSELVSQARADGLPDAEISSAIGLSSTMQAIDDAVIEYQSDSRIFKDKACDSNNYMLQLLSEAAGTVNAVAIMDSDDGELPVIKYGDEDFRGQRTPIGYTAPEKFSIIVDDRAIKFADSMVDRGYISEEYRNDAISDFSQMAYMYGAGVQSNMDGYITYFTDTSDMFALMQEATCGSVASNCAWQMNIKDQNNWDTIYDYVTKRLGTVISEVECGRFNDESAIEKNRKAVAAAYRAMPSQSQYYVIPRVDNGYYRASNNPVDSNDGLNNEDPDLGLP